MDRWMGKVAVVTGASSGIGLAIAKALVEHGMIVVGLDVQKAKMEEISVKIKDAKVNGNYYEVECDLTNEQQVKDAFQWIKNNLATIHILINNAAMMTFGKIIDLEFEDLKKVLDLNVTGLLLCSKLAIDVMKEGGHESHIVMMNSITGIRISQTPPTNPINIYPATKFAVRALTQLLEKELYGENIRFTSISPGSVKTPLLQPLLDKPDQAKHISLLEPEDIADAIIYCIGTPPRVQIEELTIKPRKAPY